MFAHGLAKGTGDGEDETYNLQYENNSKCSLDGMEMIVGDSFGKSAADEALTVQLYDNQTEKKEEDKTKGDLSVHSLMFPNMVDWIENEVDLFVK